VEEGRLERGRRPPERRPKDSPASPREPLCLILASRVTLFSCIGEPLGNRSIPSVISESSSDGKAPLHESARVGRLCSGGAVAYVLPERRLA
jgi:hypothetical protein